MDLERRNWLKEALESNLSESKKMAELLNIIFEDKDKFYSLGINNFDCVLKSLAS
jgi:hypothetical protein